jgi:hypothetical protein
MSYNARLLSPRGVPSTDTDPFVYINSYTFLHTELSLSQGIEWLLEWAIYDIPYISSLFIAPRMPLGF